MKNNDKLWIILSLIVVFIAGIASGVLVDKNLLNKQRHDSRRRSPTRFPTLEMMAEELVLSSEQQDLIREIFHKNEEHFKNLRRDMDVRLSDIRSQLLKDIKSVLDENQKIKFDAMIDKYRAQRKRERDEWMRRRERSDRNKGEK